MKKKIWVTLVFALSILLLLSTAPLLARTRLPQATQMPSPTPGPITLVRVEPAEMSSATGGTLSLYGTGFNADCVVRLVGYGLLPTTFINERALTAQVPPQVPPRHLRSGG